MKSRMELVNLYNQKISHFGLEFLGNHIFLLSKQHKDETSVDIDSISLNIIECIHNVLLIFVIE